MKGGRRTVGAYAHAGVRMAGRTLAAPADGQRTGQVGQELGECGSARERLVNHDRGAQALHRYEGGDGRNTPGMMTGMPNMAV